MDVSKRPQHAMIYSIFQLSFYSSSLRIKLNALVTLPPNYSNSSWQEHSLFFSQHFSYSSSLPHSTPLVYIQPSHRYCFPYLDKITYNSAHSSLFPNLIPFIHLCPSSAATCDPKYYLLVIGIDGVIIFTMNLLRKFPISDYLAQCIDGLHTGG